MFFVVGFTNFGYCQEKSKIMSKTTTTTTTTKVDTVETVADYSTFAMRVKPQQIVGARNFDINPAHRKANDYLGLYESVLIQGLLVKPLIAIKAETKKEAEKILKSGLNKSNARILRGNLRVECLYQALKSQDSRLSSEYTIEFAYGVNETVCEVLANDFNVVNRSKSVILKDILVQLSNGITEKMLAVKFCSELSQIFPPIKESKMAEIVAAANSSQAMLDYRKGAIQSLKPAIKLEPELQDLFCDGELNKAQVKRIVEAENQQMQYKLEKSGEGITKPEKRNIDTVIDNLASQQLVEYTKWLFDVESEFDKVALDRMLYRMEQSNK
jgi:hypothetical protein